MLDDPVSRTCCECSVFNRQRHEYHQRVVHSGDKPSNVICAGKHLTEKTLGKSLSSSHFRFKPSCSVCGKQFGRRHRDITKRRHKREKYACNMYKAVMSSQQLWIYWEYIQEKPFGLRTLSGECLLLIPVDYVPPAIRWAAYDCAKCEFKSSNSQLGAFLQSV